MKKVFLFAFAIFVLVPNAYADRTFRTTEYYLGLGSYPEEGILTLTDDGKLCLELYDDGPMYCPEESSWSRNLFLLYAYYYGFNIYSEYNCLFIGDTIFGFRLYRSLETEDGGPDQYFFIIGYEI